MDQAEGVGGTWWVNRYPGCACDVQSHLYSLSFAPKADWSRHFPPRAEIQAHLADCVEHSGLRQHLQLGRRMVRACWIETARLWQIEDQHGQVYRAQYLVSAIGGLSRPNWPAIPGLDQFTGPVIHSQQWPDQLALAGKRVAVIGSGASAIQFVPQIATSVARLDLYQRTPQWILPKPDRPIAGWKQLLYHYFPPARLATRLALFTLLETRLPAFARLPSLSAFHRWKAKRFLARQVSDPELVAKLSPDYAMGCKRVLMSNDFYPALQRPNVELITERIDSVSADGIRTTEGHERPVDLIILATGFRASEPVPEGLILGRDGRDLAECWEDGPQAYKGTSVHGFPNLFTLLGPNTALGHNSVLLMIESQINYVLAALAWQVRLGYSVLEVKAEPQRAWNQRLERWLAPTVWNAGGCSSWYRHPRSGRNSTLWPRSILTFRHHTRRFDPEAYRFDLAMDCNRSVD